jgi:hypothetical protein
VSDDAIIPVLVLLLVLLPSPTVLKLLPVCAIDNDIVLLVAVVLSTLLLLLLLLILLLLLLLLLAGTIDIRTALGARVDIAFNKSNFFLFGMTLVVLSFLLSPLPSPPPSLDDLSLLVRVTLFVDACRPDDDGASKDSALGGEIPLVPLVLVHEVLLVDDIM